MAFLSQDHRPAAWAPGPPGGTGAAPPPPCHPRGQAEAGGTLQSSHPASGPVGGGSDSERVCTGHHAPSSWTPGLPGGGAGRVLPSSSGSQPPQWVSGHVSSEGWDPRQLRGCCPPTPAVATVNITWSHGWFFCSLYEAGRSLLARTAGRQGGRPRGHRQARESVPHKASL